MDKLNPFNILIYAINFLYGIYATLITSFFGIWTTACSAIWIWLAIALFIPDIVYIDHITWLMNVVVIDPVLWIFNFFYDFAEVIRVEYLMPATNGFRTAFYLMGWLLFVGLALACMPMIWLGWCVFAYFGFAFLLSGEAQFMFFAGTTGGATTGTPNNIQHLMQGRTTIEEVYAADVNANAIAEALSRMRR